MHPLPTLASSGAAARSGAPPRNAHAQASQSPASEVWESAAVLADMIEAQSRVQLRCASPRSLIVAFRVMKKARKIMKLNSAGEAEWVRRNT